MGRYCNSGASAERAERIASSCSELTNESTQVVLRDRDRDAVIKATCKPIWHFTSGVRLSTTHMLGIQLDRFKTYNLWEQDEERWWGQAIDTVNRQQLCSTPKDGCAVLDVGAALGYYTIMSRLRLPAGVAVHAFNPHWIFMSTLRQNLMLNQQDGSVCLHEQAVSNTSGDLVRFGFGYAAGLGVRDHRVGSRSMATVQTTTLDEWARQHLSEQRPPFLLVKIDVEGAADLVLQAATKLIGVASHFVIGIHSNQELDAVQRAIGPPAYEVLTARARGSQSSPNGEFVARLGSWQAEHPAQRHQGLKKRMVSKDTR